MSDCAAYTDTELFELISDSNEKAFEILYHRYLPRLQPVMLNIVKSEPIAKDLVHDLFLKLWLNRDKLQEVDEPKNYIFRMAYNLSFNQLKKKAIEQKGQLISGINDAAVEDSMQDLLDMREVKRLVEKGVQTLPYQTKLIYEMSRTKGMKAQEIATELGLSVQTVRNTISRAIRQIRDYLANEGVILPVFLLMRIIF